MATKNEKPGAVAAETLGDWINRESEEPARDMRTYLEAIIRNLDSALTNTAAMSGRVRGRDRELLREGRARIMAAKTVANSALTRADEMQALADFATDFNILAGCFEEMEPDDSCGVCGRTNCTTDHQTPRGNWRNA